MQNIEDAFVLEKDTAILALDLGTHTGWALRGRDGTVTSGTTHFTPQRFEGGGMRYLRFKRWLTELNLNAGAGTCAVTRELVVAGHTLLANHPNQGGSG